MQFVNTTESALEKTYDSKLGPWSDWIRFGQSYGCTKCAQKSLTASDSSFILMGTTMANFQKLSTNPNALQYLEDVWITIVNSSVQPL